MLDGLNREHPHPPGTQITENIIFLSETSPKNININLLAVHTLLLT